MASARHVFVLLIVTLFHNLCAAAAAVTAADIPARLRQDVAGFVPSCAAACLASFLAVNYARGDDSDRYLDLDFVCAHRGRSGYTVGEGALQCLAGERNVGFCSEAESGDDAASKANEVCSSIKDAAEPKGGGVITVTLEYGPTSGILTFAPITSSESALPIPTPPASSRSSSSSSASSSPNKTTATTATPTKSATTIPITPTGTSTTTASTTATSPSPTDDAAAAAASQPLSKGQIAGISVGAVCISVGLFFGIILFTRFLLRRRGRRGSGSSGSSFGPSGPASGPGGVGGHYTPPPTRDTWGYRFDKSSHSNSRRSSWAPPPPAELSGYPVMSGGGDGDRAPTEEQHLPYNRHSWRPSAIGLAISPSKLFMRSPTASTPTRTPRPLSKLLPAKPDMQKQQPVVESPPPPPPIRSPLRLSRPLSYQEGREDQIHSQQQQQQHPIAAQFMRTAAHNEPPPSLRLLIPDTTPSSPPLAQDKELLSRPGAASGGGRDSTLTEFEEDGLRRSTSTAAGHIWHPPSSAVPESAVAAYYVADGHGNWILGPDPKSPLSAGSAPRIATATTGIVATAVQTQIPPPRRSSPGAPPAAQQQQPDSPQELAATPLAADTMRVTKGERQQEEAPPPPPPWMGPIARTPKSMPSPLFSRQPNPRAVSQPVPSITIAHDDDDNSAANNGRSLTARPAQARVLSTDSGITTFSISTAVSEDPGLRASIPAPAPQTPGGTRTLSPVAESPPRNRTPAIPSTKADFTDSSGSPSSSSNVFTDRAPATVATSESSSSGGGVSPVSYPRIHGRGRPVLPGVAPSRAALLGSQQELGRPNPTTAHNGAAVVPSFQRQPPYLPYGDPDSRGGGGGGMSRGRGRVRPSSQDMTRLRPPPHMAHAARQRTGSPTMRIVEPSPKPQPADTSAAPAASSPRDDRTLLPSSNLPSAPRPRRRPPSHLPHPFPMYPVSRPPRTAAAAPQPPPPPTTVAAAAIDDDRDSFGRYPGHPMPMPRPYRPQDRHASWRSPPPPQQNDNSSQEALATSPSSLLRKRLGPTRAADMALVSQEQGRDRWLQQQKQQQQKTEQGGNGKTQGTTQGTTQVPGCPGTPGLPSTPNWLPRLTPTRRGEDLVLNVA